MNREEAAEFTRKLVARAEINAFPKTPKTINNIPVFFFEAVLSALRGPQPDPITGLVPCGCGGRPTFHHAYIAKGDKCYFECTACGARGALRLDEERARYSWNTAMGWRADDET